MKTWVPSLILPPISDGASGMFFLPESVSSPVTCECYFCLLEMSFGSR